MYKVLIPVDGSTRCERAARHIVGFTKVAGEMEVHLLYVHPEVKDWEVKRFLREQEIEAVVSAQAEEALQASCNVLKAAGIPYVVHTVVGEVAQTIAAMAESQACDQIIMGTRGMTALGDLLLGSVATKVLHLVHVPVTLVK